MLAIATLQSVLALFRTRQEQALVELALRQQLAVSLQRRNSSSSEWPRRTTGGHGRSQAELSKLGIRVSLATVSRYLPKAKPDPASSQRWITFLRNHRELIAGMDFLVVPTVRFQLLYVWFAIDHGRRQIPHCNVTANPAARWVIQQLREAFPDESAHRFLILDNDAIFSAEVTGSIANSGIVPRRTALRSPWQNGIAERFVGTVRRELPDHVVVLSEDPSRRLLREYIAYYNAERVHTSIIDAPNGRACQMKPSASARVTRLSRVGGLHGPIQVARAA